VAPSPTCFGLDSSNTFDRTHTWDLSRSFFHVPFPSTTLGRPQSTRKTTVAERVNIRARIIAPYSPGDRGIRHNETGSEYIAALVDAGMDVSLRHIVAAV